MALVENIEHGWSLMGHYYVTFDAVEGKQTRVECSDKDQAKAIADALGEQTWAMARARAEGYVAGLKEGKRHIDLSSNLEEAGYVMSQVIGEAQKRSGESGR
jgi:hypothetical protein